MSALEPKYGIGARFLSSGKHPRLCTVEDVLRTYNAKGELVRVRYVASHAVAGQIVKDHDVCEVTIAKGMAALRPKGET